MTPDFIKLTAKHQTGDRHVWLRTADVEFIERLPAGMGSGILMRGSVSVQVRENPELVLEKLQGLNLDSMSPAKPIVDLSP